MMRATLFVCAAALALEVCAAALAWESQAAPGGRLYHPVALKDVATTTRTHVCTTGRVADVSKQDDGDVHVRIVDGLGAFVILEIIPSLPLAVPREGRSVRACGIVRIDKGHRTREYPEGWPELHPVEFLEVLPR